MSEQHKPRGLGEFVAVRLEQKDIARIDALTPRFSATWHKATRSEVIRALLLSSMDEAEAKAAANPGPREDE